MGIRGRDWQGFPPQRKRRDRPEARIMLACLKYLNMKGYHAGKIKTVGGRVGDRFIKDFWQWTGLPDILCFMPELVFIEVKSETGIQSPAQKQFEEFCQKANIKYLLIRSLPELMDRIIELEDKKGGEQ